MGWHRMRRRVKCLSNDRKLLQPLLRTFYYLTCHASLHPKESNISSLFSNFLSSPHHTHPPPPPPPLQPPHTHLHAGSTLSRTCFTPGNPKTWTWTKWWRGWAAVLGSRTGRCWKGTHCHGTCLWSAHPSSSRQWGTSTRAKTLADSTAPVVQ